MEKSGLHTHAVLHKFNCTVKPAPMTTCVSESCVRKMWQIPNVVTSILCKMLLVEWKIHPVSKIHVQKHIPDFISLASLLVDLAHLSTADLRAVQAN